MNTISNVDKMRVKLFCTLLDMWSAMAAGKEETDTAGKMGVIAGLSEGIKDLVLGSGTKTRLMLAPVTSIDEPEALSCWKTDERALNKVRISIEKFGLKNPPVVQKAGSKYNIICGSLQYEACKNLEMDKMHVFLKECDAVEAEELTLLEAFTKSGLQNCDPHLINAVLKFYNQLLN